MIKKRIAVCIVAFTLVCVAVGGFCTAFGVLVNLFPINTHGIERESDYVYSGKNPSDTIFGEVKFGVDKEQLYADLGVASSSKFKFDLAELKRFEFDVVPSFCNDSLYAISFVQKDKKIGLLDTVSQKKIIDVFLSEYGKRRTSSHAICHHKGKIVLVKENPEGEPRGTETIEGPYERYYSKWYHRNLKVEVSYHEGNEGSEFAITYTDLRHHLRMYDKSVVHYDENNLKNIRTIAEK